jgi:hypothetical protein
VGAQLTNRIENTEQVWPIAHGKVDVLGSMKVSETVGLASHADIGLQNGIDLVANVSRDPSVDVAGQAYVTPIGRSLSIMLAETQAAVKAVGENIFLVLDKLKIQELSLAAIGGLDPLVYLAGAIMLLGALLVVFQLASTPDEGTMSSVVDLFLRINPVLSNQGPTISIIVDRFRQGTADLNVEIKGISREILFTTRITVYVSIFVGLMSAPGILRFLTELPNFSQILTVLYYLVFALITIIYFRILSGLRELIRIAGSQQDLIAEVRDDEFWFSAASQAYVGVPQDATTIDDVVTFVDNN